MNLLKTSSCILALALCSGAAMARQAVLIDHPKILLLADGPPLTEQQVRARIINAAQNIGWQATKDDPGHMELMYDKAGQYQAYIEVNYDAAGFDINYLRSNNLNYEERDGQRRIHPGYNRWIKNLNKQISAPLAPVPAAPGAEQ
ncbi:hypothetical protein [Comamonas sp.]|uniref:hypothetical protein n=1 Tax=Comamonas sp. TaxID=34028 RepID=UPI00289B0ED0|nr:hypothetical protein [Comamonas sp.]